MDNYLNKIKLIVPKLNPGVQVVQQTTKDTYLIRIVENIGRTNEPVEVGFIANCILFIFDVLDKAPANFDNGFEVLISNLSGVPVLSTPAPNSNALGTSLFWAIYETVKAKKNESTIKNDESLILSVVGLHYALSLAEFDLPRDSQNRMWVKDARVTLFQSNTRIREGMERIYNAMKSTDLTRGTTIFALIGVFVDTCEISDTEKIVMQYNVLMKNAYIPFIKVK